MATQPIPGPRGKLLIGNLLDVDPENATHSMHLLHQQYGPIIQLQMLNKPPIVALGSQEYVHEVCDTERFEKLVGAALKEVRNLAGNGRLGSDAWGPSVLKLGMCLASSSLTIWHTQPFQYAGLFTAFNDEPEW